MKGPNSTTELRLSTLEATRLETRAALAELHARIDVSTRPNWSLIIAAILGVLGITGSLWGLAIKPIENAQIGATHTISQMDTRLTRHIDKVATEQNELMRKDVFDAREKLINNKHDALQSTINIFRELIRRLENRELKPVEK